MAFVNPAAWLLGALFAVLIALYLWERSRRHADVPSLLLWQIVPEAIVRTRRFRPDWLFVLQCLLLALLIASLADPYMRARPGHGGPSRSVFVLDLSASMQAREGRDTRFELARTALRQRLRALRPGDEVMLIAAAHQPRVAAAFTDDHAEVGRRLDALQPVDARANLDAALSVASNAADLPTQPATVELFTDTPRQELAPQWRDSVGVNQIGETDDNLAIEGVQVSQGRFQDYQDTHAYVAVRNFARREAHGVLTLQLDDAVFSRQGFSLPPRSVSGFPLVDLPGAGVLRASLDVDDALAVDNIAHAYVRPIRPLRVLAVTESPSLTSELQRIAAATPNLQFDFASAAAYNGPNGADVVIFHKLAPPFPAEAASLYIAPAGDGSPFVTRTALNAVPILDWNAQHPVLAGLRPELPFALTLAHDMAVPPWADALLTSRADGREVALAVAGERGGFRRAALAFDLANHHLLSADHLNLLLVFLNLLDWLAPADNDVRIVRTGEVEVVDGLPALPRRIVDPHQREWTLPAASSVSLDTEYAGEYRVAANGTSVRVFANFIDAEESDIGRASQGASSPPPQRAAAVQPTRRPAHGLGSWFYPIIAALLVLEWIAARRSA